MIEYLLKVSFLIGIAFLFYKLVLQQESFFSTNRWYLIGSFLLAFGLPYVTLPPLVQHQGYLATLLQPANQPQPEVTYPLAPSPAPYSLPVAASGAGAAELSPPAKQPDFVSEIPVQQAGPEKTVVSAAAGAKEPLGWMFWLAGLYFFGVAVFGLNLLAQFISIYLKALKNPDNVQEGEFVIVNTQHRQAPCSFFQFIFIYPDDYDFETYEQIIAHEKIHVRQGHSFDLLLAELAVVVLWFNPFAWLFKREVEKNLEYQTDAILLEEERVNPDQYQLNLLQIACPNKPLRITTNYNQSLLKQRILMMNGKKSTLHAYWKYAFLVPLFFGSLLFLNEPAVSQALEDTVGQEEKKAQDNLAFSAEEQTETTSEGEIQAQGPVSVATGEKVAAAPAVEPAPQQPIGKATVDSLPKGVVLAPAIQENTVENVVQKVVSRESTSISNFGRPSDMNQGYWYGHQTEKEYCVQLKGSENTSSWNMSRCFDKSVIVKKGDNLFEYRKEAGVLQFTGNLDQEVSQGKYTFTPDASFKDYLSQQGVSHTGQNFMFFLFLGNVDKAYVNYLKSNYPDLSGKRLEELAIHGISLLAFREYVDMFQKYSNITPSIANVVEARIHGLSSAYLKEMQAIGFTDQPIRKLMEAKIHGVSPAYVSSLRQMGFVNVPLSKIIEAKIHGITPAYAKEVNSLGYGDQSLSKMIELKIHRVNSAYIKELKEAGFDNLSLEAVKEASIHGVRASYIKEVKALGYKNLSLKQVLNAKIHGLSASFLNGLAAEGFKDISFEKAIEAKIHGVSGSFVKEARSKGYDLKTLDEYIRVKIMGYAKRSSRD